MYRKIVCLIVCVFCAAGLVACTRLAGAKDSGTVLDTAEVDYSSELEENTPEALAKKSGETYQQMINGNIAPETGYEIMLALVLEDSAKQMESQRIEFISQIRASASYFKNEGVSVAGYLFSKTYYDEENDGLACIYRIQNMTDGKMYYFRQDYIKENGVWKIRGDNLVNDFAIRL